MSDRIDEIAAGVGHLAVSIANVYFVGAPGEPWVLVDTGLPGKAQMIRRAAQARYGAARPQAIVLTHGHFDHAGSAADLADHWGVPIFAHPLEKPYLTGRSPYPPGDPTVPGFMGFMMRFVKRTQGFDLGGRLRPIENSELPGMPGWECHHTPGHSPGHLSFFRRSDRTLLAGDACTTVDVDSLVAVVTKQQRVCRPPTPMNYDWKAARESVRLLSSLEPSTLACGHGVPMKGADASLQLAALAREFPIPRHGRYVAEPARVGESGIEWLPPEPYDPLPKIAAGVGVAAAAALIVAVRRRG